MTAATEIWTYRNLIYNLAQRELRSRYKKSILGWAWSLINPASMLLIYSVVFGVIFGAQPPVAGDGHTANFALYLFAGLIVWNFFNGVVMGSISQLQASGTLLNKVYFPPSCPAIANMLTVLLQACIETAILVVVMVIIGNVGWSFLLFPLMMLCLALFSIGLGLAISIYNVYLRDVGYLVGIGMNVLFYATPIVYVLHDVPDIWGLPAKKLFLLNPLTQFVGWARDAFYSLTWPSWISLLGVISVSVVTFLLGSLLFSFKARNVTEEL